MTEQAYLDRQALAKQAYGVKEFCAVHSISRSKFYEEKASGLLKTRKLGSKTLVLEEDAAAWRASLPRG